MVDELVEQKLEDARAEQENEQDVQQVGGPQILEALLHTPMGVTYVKRGLDYFIVDPAGGEQLVGSETNRGGLPNEGLPGRGGGETSSGSPPS